MNSVFLIEFNSLVTQYNSMVTISDGPSKNPLVSPKASPENKNKTQSNNYHY